MDRLPPEIREMILNDIPRSDWPILATVSHAWQNTVERHTFRIIEVESASSLSMAILSDAATTIRRAEYIGYIIYTVELPSHAKNPSKEVTDGTGDYLTAEDMKADNRGFTRAISRLFNILATWPKTATREGPALAIQATNPPHESRETVRNPEYAYLALEKHLQLPLLHCVHWLNTSGVENAKMPRRFEPLHIALETQVRLSKLCPNVAGVSWGFY